ncbi:serine hydrolase [Robertmurraya yapensis]|uniref:Serine hydrolase n=1 Tax=Bacillus yapensis TaxID=2492960 RepID=A0A431W3F2_9BACI|nr:serine hydrolase [Bacillus yapensis]RTR29933.1 serine hydrolase [Bacillus yapensis]TKS95014.1 serine hydrolase [Bacillus yapensis]
MKRLVDSIRKQIELCPGRISLWVEIGDWSFEHDSERVYSSASLIKVPILIEVLRQNEKGLFSLADSLQIGEGQRVGGSGVIQALEQSFWTIKDLMTLMITVSDNTATNMLIELLGMDAVNESMELMGLKKTKLQRNMMDFTALQQGTDNQTCASDMIRCLKVIDECGFLTEKSCHEAKKILQHQQFHKILELLDSDKGYMGSKSGSLPGVEHDCAIINYEGKTAYVAILIDQIPDGKSGTLSMKEIGKAVFDAMTTV